MPITTTKLVSFLLLIGAAAASVAGCSASPNQRADESVASASSALVTSGPACADGTIEATFANGMVGCSGAVTWGNRQNLCGGGYRPVTAAEWVANSGGATPDHNYWTNDYLNFSGSGPSACSVSTSTGSFCGADTPMRVCTASGSDAEGNFCNWTNCGLGSNTPNRFFGGCSGNTTAGTLCMPSACADGSVEETFANGM